MQLRNKVILALIAVVANCDQGFNPTPSPEASRAVGGLIVNHSLSDIEARDVLENAIASEEVCMQHLQAAEDGISIEVSTLSSLAECFAYGHIKGGHTNASAAAAWCKRAAELRRAQRLPRDSRVDDDSMADANNAKAPLRTIRAAASSGLAGASSIVATLAAHPRHPGVAILAADYLAALPSSLKTSAAIVELGVFPLLASSLAVLQHNADVLESVASAITNLVRSTVKTGDLSIAIAVTDAGILEELVSGLSLHAAELDVAVAVASALLHMCVGNQSEAVSIAGASGPLAVVLSTHAANKLVVVNTCGIVSGMLGHEPVNVCSALAAGSLVRPVVAAFPTHAVDAFVVAQLCNAVALLARHAASFDAGTSDSLLGAVDPLVDALQQHGTTDDSVASQASEAFKVFLGPWPRHSHLLADAVVASGAPLALVAALRARVSRGNHSRAASFVCGALVNLGQTTAGADAAVRAGALSVLAAALAAHFSDDAEVAENACGALSNIARHPRYYSALVQAGVVRPIVAALRSPAVASRAGFVSSASYTLGALSDFPAGRAQALAAGAPAALAAAAARHGDDSRAGIAATIARRELMLARN